MSIVFELDFSVARSGLGPSSSFPSPLRLNFEVFDMEGGKVEDAGGKRKSIEAGPWGGDGGTIWDDGIYDGVREISLVYGHCIDSIQVVYDKNKQPVKCDKHGGSGGNSTAQVKLQYPDEFFVSISGHYCPMVHGGGPIIRSLTFKSNKRTFGPFGFEIGVPFCFPVDGGSRIVGFKGRSGWYLDAVGFHISRVPSRKLLQRVNKTFKRLTSIAPKTTLPRDGEKRSA